MKTLVSGALLLIAVAAMPAFAYSDEGAVTTVEVPEPASGILLGVGVVVFVGAAGLRVLGRRSSGNPTTRPTD